jgi:hypothetical protein
MAIIYNAFARAGTVLCLSFAVFLVLAGPVRAADDLFTVEGIKVDVTAENAMAARDQAFEQAQKQAFEALTVRMVADGGAGVGVGAADMDVISSLIQDYEITEEKLSSVRYIGTYTFRFKARAVERYFGHSGVQYTDVVSKPLLVLPFYEQGGRTVIWSPGNEWIQAWNRAEALGGVVPVIVPLGDLQDVQNIGEDQALTYDVAALSDMLGRYSANEAAVAVAEPADGFAQAGAPQDAAQGLLRIHLYRTDSIRPEYVQQIEVQANPGQTRAGVFDEAVREVHAALQRDWKQKTTIATPQASRIKVRVPISSLQEWAQTQKTLERISGISEVVLQSLTPTAAFVDIMFQGTENRLRLALQQADMTLLLPDGGAMTGLGPETGISSGMPDVYELHLNRYNQDSYSNRF